MENMRNVDEPMEVQFESQNFQTNVQDETNLNLDNDEMEKRLECENSNMDFSEETVAERVELLDLEPRICQLESENLKLKNNLYKVRQLNLKNRENLLKSNKKIKELKKLLSNNNFYKALRKIFEEDQIEKLIGFKKRVNWSQNTYINAFKLKFACGTSGYNELLRLGYPFPCNRSLSKQLETLNISHGIITESFDFLKVKIECDPLFGEDCSLVVDEMNLSATDDIYDPSTCTFFGNTTIGNDKSDTADNALVFMLVGLKMKWKQIVGFHYTNKKMVGADLKPEIIKVITLAENIGLRVHNVTSDMSGPNQGLWSEFDIYVKNWSATDINNSVEHPCDKNRKLYFTPDVPHALKSIKTSLINNEIIKIHPTHVAEFGLPSDTVKSKYLMEIVKADEGDDYKLAPKLNHKILEKSHFQKMRVNNSKYTVNIQSSSSLEFLTGGNSKDPRITTVWFMQFIDRWFNIMSNRKISLALSLKNFDKYIETICFLIKAIDIFSKLEVGIKVGWKPFQTSVLISTQTVLDLSAFLLLDRKFKFFFTSRISQDCLENIFSTIRLKHVIPNAVQFKNDLKLIMMSRFMKNIKTSNYDNAGINFVSGFFEVLSKNKKLNKSISKEVNDSDFSKILPVTNKFFFSFKEMNCIYWTAGYVIKTIIDNQKVCEECIKEVGGYKKYNFYGTLLTQIRARTMKNIFSCS